MGEAVLQHVANQRNLDVHVSSCGTAGYHVGEEPDERQFIAHISVQGTYSLNIEPL
jgi:protein-tyrosine-phosphatase